MFLTFPTPAKSRNKISSVRCLSDLNMKFSALESFTKYIIKAKVEILLLKT